MTTKIIVIPRCQVKHMRKNYLLILQYMCLAMIPSMLPDGIGI